MFLSEGYNDVIEKFDRIGRKINYITDDTNIRDLKVSESRGINAQRRRVYRESTRKKIIAAILYGVSEVATYGTLVPLRCALNCSYSSFT